MEDQLISFETAKLAKEKGFDGFCFDAYNTHKMQYSNGWLEYIYDNEIEIPFTSKVLKSKDILAPTQSLLQRWLREIHNLHCSVYRMNNKWTSQIYDINKSSYINPHCYHHGYEEALEWGLREALKLI